ncbi:MAG: tRNA cyclic N6-threonylcarbamoyladenosine(37) synthase TcdA [Spongiibacteraceae bacterium]|jgi:tRNA A37 threonylcarbamoyladenosine dehydratase|nr:tRNA cyclic N6-threonylcarbamoyladenosine(37) synthase TcdA [Spongiibacteraceae bacterium]
MTRILSPGYLQRFAGVGRLYGRSALDVLAGSHCLVAGIGGVGSWAAEALARSGVGHISLVDLDDICITNSNRQVHTLASTVGQSKVAVMAARLRDINPEIRVDTIEDFVDPDNVTALLADDLALVLDATDTAHAKTALIAACRRRKLPVVTVGSAGGKRDPRQVDSADLSRTVNDPLLAKVRSQLRRFHHFPTNPKRRFSVEAVYSAEQMLYPQADGEVCQTKAFEGGVKLDCSGGFGALSMVTATFGMVAAARGIERLLARRNTKSDVRCLTSDV